MLTPKELLEVIDTMQPILDELNTFIVRDIVHRAVARMEKWNEITLTGTDAWQAQVYQEAGGHLEDLKAELQKFLRISEAEVQAIFQAAAITSVEADTTIYTNAGVEVPDNPMSERMVRILADTYKRTNGEIRNFTKTTADASQKHFVDQLSNAHMKVITGAQSYTAAVKELVNEISTQQTKVIYPTGHIDTIETAVLRAVRTGVAQACGDISLQQMDDYGWDLIRTSAHLGARYGDGGENPGNHFWWQGKLFSKSGKDPKYPPFSDTGYGTGEGLCGWNCRHSFGPGDPNHNPFKDYDDAENKAAYDLSQKQRRREASIRKSKLKLIGLREGIDTTENAELKFELQMEYDKTALRLQRQNADYREFCKDNKLATYDDRLAVAKWNRSQSAKATAAARRAKSNGAS